jgi:hypothetical protein
MCSQALVQRIGSHGTVASLATPIIGETHPHEISRIPSPTTGVERLRRIPVPARGHHPSRVASKVGGGRSAGHGRYCPAPVGSNPCGTVALVEARARWTNTLGRVSDHEGQFGERLGKPGGRRHVGPEIVEAPAEVLDEGVRGDDDPGSAVALQPSHRSKSGLQASVVSLDAVVRIHLRVMEGLRGTNTAIRLQTAVP